MGLSLSLYYYAISASLGLGVLGTSVLIFIILLILPPRDQLLILGLDEIAVFGQMGQALPVGAVSLHIGHIGALAQFFLLIITNFTTMQSEFPPFYLTKIEGSQRTNCGKAVIIAIVINIGMRNGVAPRATTVISLFEMP